jgi:hypothetical protein
MLFEANYKLSEMQILAIPIICSSRKNSLPGKMQVQKNFDHRKIKYPSQMGIIVINYQRYMKLMEQTMDAVVEAGS